MKNVKNWGCKLDNVSISWNDEPILKGVTVDINISNNHSQNMIPLVGRSADGKSSLLYVMALLKKPREGSVIWNFPDSDIEYTWTRHGLAVEDKYLAARKAAALRRKYFGFAFQESTMLNHLTVMENLVYPLRLKGEKRRKQRDIVRKAINSVLHEDEKKDVDKILKDYPTKLSGGQRQRIALAQAIVHDPYILFADEPTGSLDPVTRRQVMKVLSKWVVQDKGKKCVIWVTHHHDDPKIMKVDNILYVRNDHKCLNITYRDWLEELDQQYNTGRNGNED
ncbi:MAG: ATP-binding cassette domain-containing protein [Desulfobacteraceae bacterium]|nr:ATP-binding cassette domain-containing protein [Desulfobacteraceae bacterium]